MLKIATSVIKNFVITPKMKKTTTNIVMLEIMITTQANIEVLHIVNVT